MRSQIEAVIRWASMIFGALILTSCTIAGGVGLGSKDWRAGLLGAVGGFLGGLLVVGLLFGWVYVYFLLRRDLELIREDISKLQTSPQGGPQNGVDR